MGKTLKPSGNEPEKSSETSALEEDYDRGWNYVLEQLDRAFISDAAMLDRIVYRRKARLWARVTDPNQACRNLGKIVEQVEAVQLTSEQLLDAEVDCAKQIELRNTLAEHLGCAQVGGWRDGLSGRQVRRKVHHAWTILATLGHYRQPPLDPYAKRRAVDDVQRNRQADENAAGWTGTEEPPC